MLQQGERRQNDPLCLCLDVKFGHVSSLAVKYIWILKKCLGDLGYVFSICD